MKHFFNSLIVIMLVLLTFNNAAIAENQVKFIYIHGTNDNNYEKKKEFTEDVNRLHKDLVTEFNKSELAKKYLFEGGKYTISEKPVVFYWGAESKKDLNLLADWLDITKFFSPKIAQTVRSMIAHSFHDAIWVQKYNNMKPIVDKLHKIALRAEAHGDKYILVGHSAGTFITYEYFLYKMPFVDTEHFLKSKNIPQDKLQQIQKIGYRNTCVDALIDSNVAIFRRDYNFYVPKENIVENYKTLASVEKTSCLPENAAAGLINFGSPLTLFYSGFADNTEIPPLDTYKAIINNNAFYLNLNFAEDPLGFPAVSENDYIIMQSFLDNKEENSNYGFIYDKSNIRSNKAVFNSHMAYWRKSKFFAKHIVKAYEEGITTFVLK